MKKRIRAKIKEGSADYPIETIISNLTDDQIVELIEDIIKEELIKFLIWYNFDLNDRNGIRDKIKTTVERYVQEQQQLFK